MRREPEIILIVALALTALGVVMVYSATTVLALEQHGDSYYFLRRELVYLALGLVAMAICAKLDYHLYEKYHWWILSASIVLLLLVFVPGIGYTAQGARRWINLRFFRLQPSELAKLVIVLYVSGCLVRRNRSVHKFTSGYLPPVTIVAVLTSLVLAERDLGFPAVMGVTAAAVLFIGGAKLVYLMLSGLAACPLFTLLVLLDEERRRRILAFLDPWGCLQHDGWQLAQALVAFGTGGTWGRGIGRSVQKLYYLPAAHTDFIFAIIGEELGMIGTWSVVALFVIYAAVGMRIAANATDLYGTLVAFGLTVMISFQAALNMAVATGLVPTKGLPLPFVSYGGNSLIVSLAATGIIINVGLHGLKARREEMAEPSRL
jgi:cell division protein FtsW